MNVIINGPAVPAAVVCNPIAEENSYDNLSRQVDEVEAIVREFQRLLVRHESSLENEGIREHIETLERWVESYRRGLKAAKKLTELGPQWLHEAQEKLSLAVDEIQRMDSEGPAPTSEDQVNRAEELLRAKRRVDSLLPAMEQVVKPAEERKETVEA